MAYDLIEFLHDSNRFHDYIVHYLRDSLICEDLPTALKMIQKEVNFNKIITVDGEVVRE